MFCHSSPTPYRVPAICLLALLGLELLPRLPGQTYSLEFDKSSPEGLILNEAAKTGGDSDREGLLEQYLLIFPNGKSVAWVYDQLRQISDRANSMDKVIDYSQKILALQPSDLFSAY